VICLTTLHNASAGDKQIDTPEFLIQFCFVALLKQSFYMSGQCKRILDSDAIKL
jgi:hypothetical protein